VLAVLATFVPTALVLHLATGGLERKPTLKRGAWTAVAAALVGPVAVALVGFLGWLVLVAASVGALTAYALWRRPHGRAPQSG